MGDKDKFYNFPSQPMGCTKVPTSPINSILLMNIRGLYSNNNTEKINALYDMAIDSNAFMICLTETHLKKSINNSEITNRFWSIIRADRINRICGGAAVAYRTQLDVDHNNIITFSNGHCEMVCVYFNDLNLGNVTIYRPPGCPKILFNEIIMKAKDWINNLQSSRNNPRIIINGDLNFLIT